MVAEALDAFDLELARLGQDISRLGYVLLETSGWKTNFGYFSQVLGLTFSSKNHPVSNDQH